MLLLIYIYNIKSEISEQVKKSLTSLHTKCQSLFLTYIYWQITQTQHKHLTLKNPPLINNVDGQSHLK